MKRFALLLLVVLAFSGIAEATNRFATHTGGVASGSGDVNNPWTFDWACSSSNSTIQAGDVVWLRGGTYGDKHTCTKSGSSVVDGTARTDSTSSNVLTATGANLASVVVGDYIAITSGSGTGLILGEHWPITAVNDAADTITIAKSYTTSGSGSSVAWRIYRPIIYRSCEWACPDGTTDYTRTYEWAKLDGYQGTTTTLAGSIGTNTCSTDNITLTNGSAFSVGDTMYIYDGTAGGTDEFINITSKASANVIDGCQRDYSVNFQLGLTSHASGDTVAKVGQTINFTASYVIIRDIEIGNSWPIRAYPSRFVDYGDSIFVNNGSLYNDFINIVFAGGREAVFMADGAKFTNLYGYIAYNIGDIDSIRGNGQVWYMHGQTTDYRHITHGVAFNTFSGAKMYGVTGGASQFRMTYNTHFNFGVLGPPGTGAADPVGYASSHRFTAFQLGSETQVMSNNILSNNWGWQQSDTVSEGGLFSIGFPPISGSDQITVTDNYMVSGGGTNTYFQGFNHATFTGNTLVQGQTSSSFTGTLTELYQFSFTAAQAANLTVNNTVYDRSTLGALGELSGTDIPGCKAGAYGTTGANSYCPNSNSGGQLFLTSVTTGTQQDPGGSGACGGSNNYRFYNGCQNATVGTGIRQWLSNYTTISDSYTAAYPTVSVSEAIVNEWETGRCVLRYLNWQKTGSISPSLSSCGFVDGDTYAVWDVQYFTPWSTGSAITTGTYNSASPSVTINTAALNNVTAAIGTAGGASVIMPDHTAQDANAPLIVLIARKIGVSSGTPAGCVGAGCTTADPNVGGIGSNADDPPEGTEAVRTPPVLPTASRVLANPKCNQQNKMSPASCSVLIPQPLPRP